MFAVFNTTVDDPPEVWMAGSPVCAGKYSTVVLLVY